MVNKYITIKNRFNFINFSAPLDDFKPGFEWETFLDFCSDLEVRQFTSIIHTNDMPRQVSTLKVFLKLELRLLRSKDLNFCSVMMES